MCEADLGARFQFVLHRVGLNLSTDATFQQMGTLNFPQVLLNCGFGPKQLGGRKFLRSRPRILSHCSRRRSQKMLRTWQNCDFVRDIQKKCQVLNILRDALLGAVDRFLEQFLKNIRWTTGAPVVDPIRLRSCSRKRSTAPRRASRMMLRTWHFLRMSRANSRCCQVLNNICDRLLGQGDGILGRLLRIFGPQAALAQNRF